MSAADYLRSHCILSTRRHTLYHKFFLKHKDQSGVLLKRVCVHFGVLLISWKRRFHVILYTTYMYQNFRTWKKPCPESSWTLSLLTKFNRSVIWFNLKKIPRWISGCSREWLPWLKEYCIRIICECLVRVCVRSSFPLEECCVLFCACPSKCTLRRWSVSIFHGDAKNCDKAYRVWEAFVFDHFRTNETKDISDNKKEKIESADFCALEWKLRGLNVNPPVKKILQSLWTQLHGGRSVIQYSQDNKAAWTGMLLSPGRQPWHEESHATPFPLQLEFRMTILIHKLINLVTERSASLFGPPRWTWRPNLFSTFVRSWAPLQCRLRPAPRYFATLARLSMSVRSFSDVRQ